MLKEMGHRADRAIAQGTDVVYEAAHVTVLHVRRIVGALAEAVVRVKREAEDLVWDYHDLGADLRRDDLTSNALPEVGRIELRRD